MSDSAPATAQVLVRLSAPLHLGPAAVERELAGPQQAAALAAQLRQTGPERELYLVLDGLRVETDPGVLYQVELVSRATGQAAATEAAGSFSLYGVAHAHGASAQRSFVVTGAVRRLAARGGFALRLQPGPGAAPATKVEIGQIYLVLQ